MEDFFLSLAAQMEKTKLNKQFDKQFGQFVKRKREEKGWSQAELANLVENNYQNISRLERGEITPTLFWCYKLAKAFDVELPELIEDLGFSERSDGAHADDTQAGSRSAEKKDQKSVSKK